jgi:hypothetical protein
MYFHVINKFAWVHNSKKGPDVQLPGNIKTLLAASETKKPPLCCSGMMVHFSFVGNY